MSSFQTLIDPDRRWHWLLLVLAGALCTFAFQPFGLWPLLLPAFGLLLYSWHQVTPARALFNGWCFGVGLQSAGVSWIFWSLHYHGGAPAVMAVLTIFLLAAYLSIYTALAGYVANRLFPQRTRSRLVLVYPLCWGIFEWLQGIVLTGFAWMQPGYAVIDTPLSGFAPLLGNHALGSLLLLCIALLLAVRLHAVSVRISALAIIGLLIAGIGLQQHDWTSPRGEAVTVSLVQGNIPQHLKWRRDMKAPTLKLYREQSLGLDDSDIIIWPETALPGYQHRLKPYLDDLQQRMQDQGSELLLGLFIRDEAAGGYYNSLLSVDGQVYHKRHLVPLGEYIPLRSLVEFFNAWVHIPMSDIAHGKDEQALMQAAGVKLGVTICFEDAFARDVLRDLPEAELLVNVSNDAWFDGSHQTLQHHTMARMRAIESGRWMVRSTNTGFSSIIDHRGEVLASSPLRELHVLTHEVQPMQGITPYTLWGDTGLLLLSVLVLLLLRYRHYQIARVAADR